MKKPFIRNWIVITVLALGFIGFINQGEAGSSKRPIIIADQQWDSGMMHARIVAFIIQHGYGHLVELIPSNNMQISLALMLGKMDIMMESWHHSWIERYNEGIKAGSLVDLGQNFEKTEEGWYVPTYIIKGDPKHGIKPMAPDLKSVSDLPRYWKLFTVPESPDKGRIYDGSPGWGATKTDEIKIKTYGLSDKFEQFISGSGTALAVSMVSAYEKGKPWLGYYWAPTWLLGKYDLTKLEEPPFDGAVWEKNRGCEYPSGRAHIIIHQGLFERAPEVVEFLKKYETTLAFNNAMLARMRKEKLKIEELVSLFFKEYSDQWTAWVTNEAAMKIRGKLQ